MKLWSIQSEEVYLKLLANGVYINQNSQDGDLADFPHAFSWLREKLQEKGCPAPEQAALPVFAWKQWEPVRKRPDLRWFRRNWAPAGKYALLELEVPEDQLLLFDSKAWCIIMNNSWVTDSEEEWNQLFKTCGQLSPEEEDARTRQTWDRALDTEFRENDHWRGKGEEVEAAFWVLRKEMIRKVTPFTSVFRSEYTGPAGS